MGNDEPWKQNTGWGKACESQTTVMFMSSTAKFCWVFLRGLVLPSWTVCGYYIHDLCGHKMLFLKCVLRGISSMWVVYPSPSRQLLRTRKLDWMFWEVWDKMTTVSTATDFRKRHKVSCVNHSQVTGDILKQKTAWKQMRESMEMYPAERDNPKLLFQFVPSMHLHHSEHTASPECSVWCIHGSWTAVKKKRAKSFDRVAGSLTTPASSRVCLSGCPEKDGHNRVNIEMICL